MFAWNLMLLNCTPETVLKSPFLSNEQNIKNGEWITKKTVIELITDSFGEFERKIYAPFDCYVFCVNISPIMNRGDAIFHVSLEAEEVSVHQP
ncbi:MAG: hypothetical protein ACI9LN_001833 [Saprospiraceae bacterium]